MNDLTGWHVLVVEDEADAQAVVCMILTSHGAQVSTAYTGEEALEVLTARRPTVAVIDLALPEMDGWELLETMRSNPDLAGIPAVAMTAYHSTNVAQEAVAAGFAAYFPKPLNAQTFAEDLIRIVG